MKTVTVTWLLVSRAATAWVCMSIGYDCLCFLVIIISSQFWLLCISLKLCLMLSWAWCCVIPLVSMPICHVHLIKLITYIFTNLHTYLLNSAHQTSCKVNSFKWPVSVLSSEAISDLYSFTLVVALSKLSSSSQIVIASCRFSSLNFCTSSECLWVTFAISSAVLASADNSSASNVLIFSFSSAYKHHNYLYHYYSANIQKRAHLASCFTRTLTAVVMIRLRRKWLKFNSSCGTYK